MKKRRVGTPKINAKAAADLVLGHERFAKISAVEGIVLTAEMRKRISDFDRQGLSAEERRASILRVHRKG